MLRLIYSCIINMIIKTIFFIYIYIYILLIRFYKFKCFNNYILKIYVTFISETYILFVVYFYFKWAVSNTI